MHRLPQAWQKGRCAMEHLSQEALEDFGAGQVLNVSLQVDREAIDFADVAVHSHRLLSHSHAIEPPSREHGVVGAKTAHMPSLCMG